MNTSLTPRATLSPWRCQVGVGVEDGGAGGCTSVYVPVNE